MMSNPVRELKNRWQQAGIRLNAAAVPSQIEEFESRSKLLMSPEFRRYFLEINGTPESELDGLARLWSLAEVACLASYAGDEIDHWFSWDATQYFVFGDYNIEGSLWAIRLDKTEETGNSILSVYVSSRFCKEVACDFGAFLRQYLNAGAESLI